MRPQETESFFMAKDTIIQTQLQAEEWENIFSNYTYDRVLISKIYKEELGKIDTININPIKTAIHIWS